MKDKPASKTGCVEDAGHTTPLTTRTRLLDAAMVVLLGEDGASIGISDITSASGFTKGAVYHHFSSKDDLIYALAAERLLPEMEEIIDLRWIDLRLPLDEIAQRLCEDGRGSFKRRTLCQALHHAVVADSTGRIARELAPLWQRSRTVVRSQLRQSDHVTKITVPYVAEMLMTSIFGQSLSTVVPAGISAARRGSGSFE